VTSSGRYVIAWDFKKVKKGILDKYEIKQYVIRPTNAKQELISPGRYDDKVVQDQFRFANDNDIVGFLILTSKHPRLTTNVLGGGA
jgi:hypothetical protein